MADTLISPPEPNTDENPIAEAASPDPQSLISKLAITSQKILFDLILPAILLAVGNRRIPAAWQCQTRKTARSWNGLQFTSEIAQRSSRGASAHADITGPALGTHRRWKRGSVP